MPLDSELLDRFERDWNDALAHYDARATATRLADTSVPPWARTQLNADTASALNTELLAPLQAKWGALASLLGGARTSSAPPRPQFFNTSAGVVMADPFTGHARKIFDAPRVSTAARDRTRELLEQDLFKTRQTLMGKMYLTPDQEKALADVNRQIEALRKPVLSPDPAFEAKFAQSPMEMMRPLPPTPKGFIGVPGEENFFEPGAGAFAPAAPPPPPASSTKRYKWVRGQLQPK